MVNGVKSKPQEVISGVPQEGVLGPLIFLIPIGDIDENVIHCPVKSLADETHAAKSIKKLGKSQAAQNIFTTEKERAITSYILGKYWKILYQISMMASNPKTTQD